MEFINGGSEARDSRNLSVLVCVKSLVKGLTFEVCSCRSKKVKFGKWSAMSVIRLPEEHLF